MGEFFTLPRSMGTTVPGKAKWALRVYDCSLNPPLPSGRPAVAALPSRGRSDVPKHAKHAPMLELELPRRLGRLAVDGERLPGVRFYAIAYLLLVFASLGFPMWKPYLKYGDPRQRSAVDPSIGNPKPHQLSLGQRHPDDLVLW